MLYLVTVILATYPLVTEMDQRVPYDLGDPLFISWVVSWNNEFLINQQFSLSALFDTNIYYPYKNTLAYSDLMLVPSIMVSPVYYLTKNPIVTVNSLLFLLLALSAFAMFLLVRHLTDSVLVAFISGFFYLLSSYHLSQIGHVQLHADAFMLLMLLFLHQWLDSRETKYLALAVFMLFLEALSSWYYAIYAGLIFIAFTGFFLGFKKIRVTRRALASLVIALITLVLFLYPFISPYLQLHESMPNFERSIGESAVYSAGPADYLYTVEQNLFWGRLLGLSRPGVENILFPGLAVILLAVLGLWGLRAGIAKREKAALIKLFYLLIAFSAFVLSLGPYKTILGQKVPLPFLVAFEFVPGFKSMRVPARFGLLVLVGLIVLAAFGTVRLLAYWRKKRKDSSLADIVAIPAIIFLVFQQVALPTPISQPIASGDHIPPIYKWLRNYKAAEVIIELPPAQTEQVKYVYYSAYHSKRLVNGYSGYTPPLWADIESRVVDFPSAQSISLLKELGVDGVIVHSGSIPDWKNKLSGSKYDDQIKLIKQFSGDYYFKLLRTKTTTHTKSIKLKN